MQNVFICKRLIHSSINIAVREENNLYYLRGTFNQTSFEPVISELPVETAKGEHTNDHHLNQIHILSSVNNSKLTCTNLPPPGEHNKDVGRNEK